MVQLRSFAFRRAWLFFALFIFNIPLSFADNSEFTEPTPSEKESILSVKANPIQFRFGFQKAVFQCPCLRFSMVIKGAGGEIETQHFLISADALFKYYHSTDIQFDSMPVQFVNMLAAEVLWKQGHIGLGFDGITIGKDLDASYEDIIKTGAYFLVNAFRNDAMRLDFRTGYDFEKMTINRGPVQERNFVGEEINFNWMTKRWSGKITAFADFQPSPTESSFYWRFGSAMEHNVHMVNTGNFFTSLGLHTSYDYDSFRDALGLIAFEARALIYMDISWIHEPLFKAKK